MAVALPEAARRLFGNLAATGAEARAAPTLNAPASGAPNRDTVARAAPTQDAPMLDIASPDPHVVARLLEDGDREDLAWLCRQLPAGALAAWVERHGARRLSRRSLSFWAVTLDRPDLLPGRRPELERRRELWPL